MSKRSKTLKRFTIRLTKSESVYYPGDIVSGKVTIISALPISFTTVQLRFYGRVRVCLEKQDQYKQTSENYDEKMYLDRSVFLAGSDKDNEPKKILKLAEGRYDFQFDFPLPKSGLPSSFEGLNGNSIRYIIDVMIEIPKKQTRVARKVITILENIDCKLSPFNEPSIPIEIEKTFGCFCCNSGRISFTCKLARRCYCPGENVVLQLNLDNGLNQRLSAISVKLVRKLYLHSDDRHMTDRKEYIKKDLIYQIDPYEKFSSEVLAFTLPCIAPTNLISRTLQVEYVLEVEVIISQGSSLAVVLPIIVGSVLPETTISEINEEPVRKPTIVISSPVTVTLPRQFSFTNRTSLKHASLDKKLSQNSTDSIKVVVKTADKNESNVTSPSPSFIALSSEEAKTESRMPTPLINRAGLATLKHNLPLKSDNTEDVDTLEQPSFAPCIDGPVFVEESDDKNYVFFGNTQFVPRYAYAKQIQF